MRWIGLLTIWLLLCGFTLQGTYQGMGGGSEFTASLHQSGTTLQGSVLIGGNTLTVAGIVTDDSVVEGDLYQDDGTLIVSFVGTVIQSSVRGVYSGADTGTWEGQIGP